MKLRSLISLFLFLAAAQAHANSRIDVLQGELVDLAPAHVFAPLGFDDNDNVQIVLDGVLPDTCHKLAPTQPRVDHEAHKIYLHPQAYFYPSAWCAEVRTPYAQALNLGIMSAGQYEIILETAKGEFKPIATLPVAIAASPSADEFLYAPVSQVEIRRSSDVVLNQSQPADLLVIGGFFPTTCMSFKEIRLHVRPNNVIEVLPIITIDETSACLQTATQFNAQVSLKGVPHGHYLVHIRAMGGQAVNRIIDL